MGEQIGNRSVGIVGLGIMGGAMARNLLAAGWQVAGYDPDPAATAAMATAGVAVQPDCTALARAAPLLMTSLATPAALQATAAAIAATNLPRRVVVEVSTMSLDDKNAFAAALPGHAVLDCPMSGTGAQAARRDLVVYASGDSSEIESLRPFFADFTRAVHDVGPYGNGSRMKFVANLLVAIHNVAAAEAMVLGMKAGLDPHKLVELVSAGVGTSRVFDLRAPMMADNAYGDATMKVSVWQKDMAVIGAYAASLGVATPLLSATVPIYNSAMATGHAADDTAAVCDVLARMSGLQRPGGTA